MIKRNAILCIISYLLASCQYYYVPRAHYVPVFNQKGDININLGIAHQQIGYAITDNLGLFLTNHIQKQSDLLPDETDCSGKIVRSISGIGQSLGLVPYYSFADFVIIEAPIAYGRGSISGNGYIRCGTGYSSSFKNGYQSFSIQPTITHKPSEHYDISIFGRYSLYQSNILESTVSTGHLSNAYPFDILMTSRDVFYDSYFDWGIQQRLGYKNMKLYIQLCYTFYEKSNHNLNQLFAVRTGLSFNFNTHKKQIKQNELPRTTVY